MDRGEVLAHGTPKFVVSRYHKLIYAPVEKAAAIREGIREETAVRLKNQHVEDEARLEPAAQVPTVPEDIAYLDEGLVPQSTLKYQTRGATISAPRIETLQGRRVNVLKPGGEYVYTYAASFQCTAVAVRFGMMIKTITGLELGGAASAPAGMSELITAPGDVLTVRFRFRAMLAPGVYFLNAGVTAQDSDGETYLDRLIDVAMFRVMPDEQRLATGTVDFHVAAEITAEAVLMT